MTIPDVLMVDLNTGVLHTCGDVHLHATCGRYLGHCKVGAARSIVQDAVSPCPTCFPDFPVVHVIEDGDWVCAKCHLRYPATEDCGCPCHGRP